MKGPGRDKYFWPLIEKVQKWSPKKMVKGREISFGFRDRDRRGSHEARFIQTTRKGEGVLVSHGHDIWLYIPVFKMVLSHTG